MEYIKGKPYFCDVENKIKQYPYLTENLNCDILTIGGGIDGAIANYYLSKKYKVVLVDKSRFGFACSSCATALCEYQLDEFSFDLNKYLTEEQVAKIYNFGLSAIKKLEKFLKIHGNYCNFIKKSTFLYANSKNMVKNIKKEFNFRIKNNFPCKLYLKNNNPFNFELEAGLLAENGGCEVNPYLLTKQMIENSENQNLIFENTNIINLTQTESEIIATTNFGNTIKCKKVIVATGFNWEVLNATDLCERFISYSIVTEPIEFDCFSNLLVHDLVEPYHYMRALPDKRIIFDGEDTTFKEKPISEKKANKKYQKLEKDFFNMFPNLQDTKIEYKFCGAFGTTKNNLGLIGESANNKNILLFISCGANGIINAIKGIEIIEDTLQNKPNEFLPLFSPKRKHI